MSFSIEAILKPSFGVKSSRNIDLYNTQPMDMRKYRNEDDKVDYKTARIQGEYSSRASPTTSTSSVSATSSRSNSPVSDCTISRDNIVNNDLNDKYETCSDSKHDQSVYTEDEFEALESNSFSNPFNRIYNFDTKFLHRNLYQNFQTMKQFLYPHSALSNLYFGEKFPSKDIQPDPRIFPIYHNSMDAFHSMKTLSTREVNNGRTSDLYTIIHSAISAQMFTSVCSDKKFSSSDNNFSHKTFNDTSKICSHKKFCSTSNECSEKNSCGTHSFQNKSSCSAGSTHPDDISCTISDKKLRSTHSTSSDRHIVKTANTCPGKTFLSENTTCSNNAIYNCSEKKFIIPGYPSPDKKLSSRDNSCSYKKIKNVTLGRNKCSTNIKQGNQSSNDVGKEIKEEKRHKDPFVWPAWVYCTRYSDRPSSGPRYRKPRARSYNDDDKRPRTAFSTQQLHRLRREFESCPYLSETRRQNLAVDLGLNESQVKIWFQNKRAKLKKSSGNKNTLAMRLMQEGLYNHSTIVVDDAHDDSDKSKNNIVG